MSLDIDTEAPRRVLVFRHVPWEGPHRVLDAFRDRPAHVVDVLDHGAVLPPLEDVAAAVVMYEYPGDPLARGAGTPVSHTVPQ